MWSGALADLGYSEAVSIVVGGASGNLGRRVAELLVERVPPAEVILCTRTPDALEHFAAKGVRVRYADYDRPESLADAFTGGKALLLISTGTLDRREAQHRAAIDAASSAGITRIAYTSILSPVPENPAAPTSSHRATELALQESGLAWTFLRNSLYADFQVAEAVRALASGTLVHNRGDGRVAYVSREDCAAAAAAVLATPGHDRVAYDITGPEQFGAVELAALYTELGGRAIEIVEVDDETFRAGMIGDATGDDHRVYGAELVTSTGKAIREGYLSACTNAVAELTGRAPRRLRDVVAARRDELAAAATAA
jgi:NAD(P)H dehydrogenase (quinone)